MIELLAGQQFIAGHGVATVVADLDFETYSEAGYRWDPLLCKWKSLEGLAEQNRGLPAVGVYNYVTHPTFEVLSVAYDLKDGRGKRWWRPGMPQPEDLLQHVREGKPLEAHNEGFEWHVWMLYCVRAFGWPPLLPEAERCSQAKARAWSLPAKLANVGIALRLPPELMKDKDGTRLIQKLTVPRNPTKGNPDLRWYPHTAPEDFAAFYRYNVQDIESEGAASIRIPDLVPRELEIWRVDQNINRRGMQIDTVGVQHCINIVEQATAKYSGRLREITGYRVHKHTEVAQTLEWLQTQGVYLGNLDEETVGEQLKVAHSDGVREVLRIRQALSFGSVKKLYAMRAQVCSDGRLRDQYAFHGAHTALWNGQGVQVANLYTPGDAFKSPDNVEMALACIASGSLDYVEGVYGDALECVANCLRSMIVAPKGKLLISSDFTAIQAVITSALAGEQWRLDVFATHGKIYETMASLITGKPLQFYLDYKKETGKHHADRQLGKLAVLSADFGAWINGWKRFGADKILGPDEEIKRVILLTRNAQPMVGELWGGQVRDKFRSTERPELFGLEGAAIKAVLDPGKCYGYRGIRYVVHDDVLYCQPPGDGAPLCYHEPRLTPTHREYSRPWELDLSYMGWNSNQTKGAGGWVRMPLYGGVLTQNVVAKSAREFQADALVEFERSGWAVPVMHTHDEGVCEIDEERGTKAEGICKAEFEYMMTVRARRPEFAGWPIKAPGAWIHGRFGKWEGL